MSKNKITKDYLAAMDAVNKAEDNLKEAKKKLKDLEEKIEAMNKKPMMYYNDGREFEIVNYRVHNVYECSKHSVIEFRGKVVTSYVEFETSVRKYRYITTRDPNRYTIPNETSKFEYYNIISNTWYDCSDIIDRIELLEGVDCYDKN